MILPRFEARLYGVILEETKRLRLEVHAIGGMPDHVHLVVRKPPSLSESTIMQQIKGVSSTVARTQLIVEGEQFRWQEHYGVFSFHRQQLSRVIEYVRNQKQHHSGDSIRSAWEETDEETDLSEE